MNNNDIAACTNDLIGTDLDDLNTDINKDIEILNECMPDIDKQKAYFEKKPDAWYRAKEGRLALRHKVVSGGGITNNLTINANISELSLKDKMEMIGKVSEQLRVIGEKMNYSVSEIAKEDVVIPEEKGVNRIDE